MTKLTLEAIKPILLTMTANMNAFAKREDVGYGLDRSDCIVNQFDTSVAIAIHSIWSMSLDAHDYETSDACKAVLECFNLIQNNKAEILVYIEENLPKEEE